MMKVKNAVLLSILAWSSIGAAAQAQGVPGRVVALKRGDSAGTADVLRELFLGNLVADRLGERPVQWLPAIPTDVYKVRGHRLQFHHYPSPAAASSAKNGMLNRLRTRQTRLAEPSFVTRCGSDLVLEFGPGEAMIGAADQTCEHPIEIQPFVRIERDRDASRLLNMLARNGSSRQAFDTWGPLAAHEPGFAYSVPSGYLYVLVSPTPAEAERARQKWADQTPNEFPQNRQWAYRCGRAMVVYDQRRTHGISVLLRRQCGAPVVGRAVVRD